MRVLINHPAFGSLWLRNAVIKGNTVEGVADNYQNGFYLPDGGLWNIPVTMNFPASCIRKREE